MIKLAPTAGQADLLTATLRTCNAATEYVAEVAYRQRTANNFAVHKLVYADLRAKFGISSQMAVRAIAKACGAYKRDKTIQPKFRPLGAVAYDQRILTWKSDNTVSILTLAGRITVPVVYPGRWRITAGVTVRSQADLVLRDRKWYLAVVVDVPNLPVSEPDNWLGVDLGIVNIAVDSDGNTHSGKAMRQVRKRNNQLRAKLQAIGTKSAKRLLRKRRRRESRFAKDVNHCISKDLVGKAKGTDRGIALENLSGIRSRITVRKAQRSDLHSWSFSQLRSFVAYKAALAGVAIRLVDPRNTSRTCPECSYIDKLNRPTRDRFCCKRCGLAGPADHFAAINISRKASLPVAVMQPNAA